jgi:hypothetical protein
MTVALVSLALTPFWREKQLILVRATDGIRLCREGSHKILSAREAFFYLDSWGHREIADIRAFFASAQPARPPVATLKDHDLLRQLREAVRVGDWVALLKEKAESDAALGTSTPKQRRLVRAIEVQMRGRMNHMGRQYKLVADADLQQLPGRDDFEVVRHDDSVRVLTGLASQPGLGSDMAASFAQALELLTQDWRPPLMPSGLILLRKVIQRVASSRSDEPAITPSQLKHLQDPTEVDFAEFEEPEEIFMLDELDDLPELDVEVVVEDAESDAEPPTGEEEDQVEKPPMEMGP